MSETKVTPTDDGDHDKFSHYVPKTAQADALILGTPIRALCGKIWVPSEFDNPEEKRPVCPECKDIYENVVQPG